MDALFVTCPTCGRPPGLACRTPGGHFHSPHAARRLAAGDASPVSYEGRPACPRCGAGPGQRCVGPSGHWTGRPHAARPPADRQLVLV